MRDAKGTYLNLTLLFFFIMLVSGFISLAINYTKAYRVKNNVLSYLEKYEGNTSYNDMLEATYRYSRSIGYRADQEALGKAESEGYSCPTYNGETIGWCYKKNPPVASSSELGEVPIKKFTVDIVVFVNLNIPVIKQMLSRFRFFWMSGTTSQIPIMD